MKLVLYGCNACGAEWEDFERHRDRPLCLTCGSRDHDRLLLGVPGKPGDVTRLPRDRRIRGAARLLGYNAARAAREGGAVERRSSEGEDPNELEAEAWLTTERASFHALMRKEGIVPTEEEEKTASEAFTKGWLLYRP